MCGIVGIYHFSERPVDRSVLKNMCNTLAHRGPDSEGLYINKSLGFGHRRLSIIDLSDAGRQPMCNENRRIWLVCNGEIYNFHELRKELISRGHRFRSRTDVEVIIHLYEERGEKLTDNLRGMFSFAIWDSDKMKLLLCRDRLGIKPLYYYNDDDKFIFASEMKAILCHKGLDKTIDYEAVRDYFTYAYIPDPKTIFKKIRKLPPAHVLTLDSHRMNVDRYWNLHFQWNESPSEDFYIDQLLEVLRDSVKLHMVSDVAFGAFLSGGVDSSTVSALMKQTNQQVRTFSIGYGDQDFSELRYAKKVAQHLGTDHYEIVVKPEDLLKILQRIVWQFDEPFADSSAIPTYYVCKAAREFVKVCLSGDGGDEVFGGYDRHIWASLYGNGTDNLSRRARKSIFRFVFKCLPPGFIFKDFVGNLALPPIELYGNRLSVFSQTIAGTPVNRLFSDDLNAVLRKTAPYDLIRAHHGNSGTSNFLAVVRFIEAMTYLPGDNLTKVDRMSMLNSLEVRVPLLDHKVIEFASIIPPKYIVGFGHGKYILKRAMENYLPRSILYRKKMGFMLPLKKWMDNELKDYLQDMISGMRLKRKGFFNRAFIDSMMEKHQSGEEDLSYQLWSLLVFEEWARQYLG